MHAGDSQEKVLIPGKTQRLGKTTGFRERLLSQQRRAQRWRVRSNEPQIGRSRNGDLIYGAACKPSLVVLAHDCHLQKTARVDWESCATKSS